MNIKKEEGDKRKREKAEIYIERERRKRGVEIK